MPPDEGGLLAWAHPTDILVDHLDLADAGPEVLSDNLEHLRVLAPLARPHGPQGHLPVRQTADGPHLQLFQGHLGHVQPQEGKTIAFRHIDAVIEAERGLADTRAGDDGRERSGEDEGADRSVDRWDGSHVQLLIGIDGVVGTILNRFDNSLSEDLIGLRLVVSCRNRR